jgi:hypothetical protein
MLDEHEVDHLSEHLFIV